MRLTDDRRGVIINLGIVTVIGLFMIGLALVSLAFQGYDIDLGVVWDYSWLLFGLGCLFLTASRLGMNLWAIILVPLITCALWYFGVMGGGF